MADTGVQVGAGVDPASLSQISAAIESSITKGFDKAFAGLRSAVGDLVQGPLKLLGDEMAKAFAGGTTGSKEAVAGFKDLNAAFSDTQKNSLKFADAYKAISEELKGLTAALNRETASVRTASADQNTAVIAASNERVATLRNEGKLAQAEARSQGDIQVREAKTSGQQRVQITREILDTIGRLEKGFGATLEGIARTSVSAVSKVFDTIKGAFSKTDKETFSSSTLQSTLDERTTVIRDAVEKESSIIKDSTFSSALKERESLVSSSFDRQATTVRESVSRQEAAIAGLTEATHKGVLGQISNASLLGGLGIGFAAIAAFKSTFTLGSDFVRGLAAIQAALSLTQDQMKGVSKEAITLGNDITLPGVSALDAAQAIQVLTLQFGSLGDGALAAAEAAAKGTLQLSRATKSSADDAGALIGSAVNVFKVNASDAVFAADAITGALTRAAGVGFTTFKDSFTQGATVFEQFVGPVESAKDTLLDFNTTLALLARNGITGSNAGAGLKQFFLQASRDTGAAGVASKQLAKNAGETGTVFFDASGKARQFSDSIEILRKGVVGLSDQARRDALGNLFGARSITIANALINSTGDSFDTLRAQIAKQGIAAKIAAAQNTGFAGALDALGSIVDTVKIQLYVLLNGPLHDITLGIAVFADMILNGAGPALHILRVGLEGVAIGLGALLAVKTATEVIGLLGKAAELAFTPMGALVTVFALVGAAGAILVDHFGGVQKVIADLTTRFGPLVSKLKGDVLDAFTSVSSFITGTVVPDVISLAKVVGTDLLSAFDTVKSFIENSVVPVIKRFADSAGSGLKTGFNDTVSFISDTAIPTLERWAGVVGRDLTGAFEATVSFIKQTVLPGFHSFVDFLTGELFPKVASVAETIGTAALTAKDKVVGFAKDVAAVVGPLIQPAIDGFEKLGTAITGFFTGGGFSQLGSGFASAGKGIGSAFSNIGQAIFTALTPVAKQVADFFVNLFSIKNLEGALAAVSNAFQMIGHTIGAIISSPTFIAGLGIALGVILKVGLTLGLSLATGIARGILDNIPQLLKDAGSLIIDNLFNWKDLGIAAIAVAAVATIIGPLVEQFTSAGEQASGGFFSGLKTKIAGAGDFLSGLFGSPGNTPFGPLESDAKAFQLKLRDVQNDARILGSTTLYEPTQAGLQQAQSDIENLSRGMSDATAAGLQLRDKFRIIGETVRSVFGGAGDIVSGLAQIPAAFGQAGVDAVKAFGDKLETFGSRAIGNFFGTSEEIGAVGTTTGQTIGQKLRESLSAAKDTVVGGFTQITDGLKTAASESGTSLGKLIVGSLGRGIAGGTAGAFFGSQIGSSDGLSQILGIGGLATSAAELGGPIGLATVGVGLLTAAFTKSSTAAKAYQADVDKIASDLDPKFTSAVKAGTLSLDDLRKGLTFGQIDSSGLSDVVKSIVDNLGDKTLNTLQQFGKISFADSFKGIIDSGAPVKEVATNVADSLTSLITSSSDFVTKFGSNADDVAALIRKIVAPGGPANLDDALLKNWSVPSAALGANKGTVDAIISSVNDATASISKNGDAIKVASAKAVAYGNGLAATTPEVQAFGQAVLDAAKTAGTPVGRGGQDPFAAIFSSMQKLIDLGKEKAHDEAVTQVATDLQNVIDKKKQIDDVFAAGVLPPGVSGFQDAINTAILGVQGIGTTIQQAFTDAGAGTISVDVRAAIDSTQLKTAADQAASVIKTGVDSGIIIDQASATKAIQPLVDEAIRGVTDPVVKQQIEDAFSNVVVTLSPQIDALKAASVATDLDTTLQATLNGQPITVDTIAGLPTLPDGFVSNVQAAIPPVTIPTTVAPPDVATAQFAQDVIDAASSSGTPGAGITIPTSVTPPSIPSDFTTSAVAAGSSGGHQIGSAIDAGTVAGISSGSAAVSHAAAAAALGAVTAAKNALGIASPSKVFQTIGQFVISGLVKGIQDNTTDLVSTVKSAVADAINAATGAVSDATQALRQGSSDLFSALFGSASVPGQASFASLQGQITQSFNSLGSALDDSFSKAADVLKRSATEKLSNADLDVLGESPTSLSPNDVLGSNNRSALVSTIEQIVSLGKTLIDQGTPAAQVTQTLQGYIDHTKDLAVQYGLNGDQVDDVIASLGLSNDALGGFVTATANLATVLGTAKGDAEKLNGTIVDLFKSSTSGASPFGTIQGVGAAEDARAGINTALNTIAGAADSLDQRANSILANIAAGTSLSHSDQLALDQGLNGRNIGTGDQFSLANRAAFESAIKQIGDLGSALLAGGSSVDYVTQQVQEADANLTAYGVSLGYNADQIQALIDQAGLGTNALGTFTQAVADAQTAAAQAAAAQAAINQNTQDNLPTAGSSPQSSNTFVDPAVQAAIDKAASDAAAAAAAQAAQGPTELIRNFNLNLSVPFGDPQAIALATANGVAQAVRLPGS